MSLTIQYIIIAVIFIIAVISVIRKFMPSKSQSGGACGKGCGCDIKTNSSKSI